MRASPHIDDMIVSCLGTVLMMRSTGYLQYCNASELISCSIKLARLWVLGFEQPLHVAGDDGPAGTPYI